MCPYHTATKATEKDSAFPPQEQHDFMSSNTVGNCVLRRKRSCPGLFPVVLLTSGHYFVERIDSYSENCKHAGEEGQTSLSQSGSTYLAK